MSSISISVTLSMYGRKRKDHISHGDQCCQWPDGVATVFFGNMGNELEMRFIVYGSWRRSKITSAG
ncbi:unnamed protein product [Ceratitis capitata]|uniref:(Mediterranean fruit fly) hypothetical protein n=1 Tax=Ceratitis capitata TaxID=7213 RepID=A0A811UID0_CERCA|nr:unnamed protein product [Ceratitis capitata]